MHCTAQQRPFVRAAVDATDGVDLGLWGVPGTAAAGPAVPPIQINARILFGYMGRPAGVLRYGS
jgi:hypothetical protein